MDDSSSSFEDIFRQNCRPNLVELSDGRLRTEDGQSFDIHRFMLAKSSNYFYAMFCSIGKGIKDILIPSIRGDILSNILTCIYTRNLYITKANICDLLIAADYLLVDEILGFMNARACGNTAYIPTDMEHIANVLTHALSVVPSFLGLSSLLQRSSDRRQLFSGCVYGAALVALFLISTVFHLVFYTRRCRSLKETLHMCDRAIIYIFIAASYTPWLILKDAERNFWTQNMSWIVWTMAVLGIVYQYYFHERYKTLETIFYLVIGITPAYGMLFMRESSGLTELCAGGAVYIVGVVFFKSDGRVPCAHAIWHIFVNIGATLHFYAVHKYLINNEQQQQQQHTES